MRFSRVKQKLSRGEPALVVTCHFADPAVYELTSLLGFDGIWMDLEHHPLSVDAGSNLMRAARVGGADIIARPAKGEFMRIGRLLEAGAQGIMYPRCETAEEAAEVVRWAKFAPEGERGVDGANADAGYCGTPMARYVQLANRHTLLIVQLESQRALENAAEIAAVPGVDVVMLGPGDLSVSNNAFGGYLNYNQGQSITGNGTIDFRPDSHEWGQHSFARITPHLNDAVDNVQLQRVNVFLILLVACLAIGQDTIHPHIIPKR